MYSVGSSKPDSIRASAESSKNEVIVDVEKIRVSVVAGGGVVVALTLTERVETTRSFTLDRTESSSCCSSVGWSPT